MSASMSLGATMSFVSPLVSVFMLRSSYFKLPAQNVIEQCEQTERRSNQHNRIEGKNADSSADITLLGAEENVRARPAAVVALLHFGIREIGRASCRERV